MLTLQGQFRYEPQPLPESPEDWWPARVQANITAALENQSDFPQRLCPDAWKWFRGVSYDQLPLEVIEVPRGSWLAARLAGACEGEAELAGLLKEHVKATVDGHELSLELSVFTRDSNEQVAAIALVFDAAQIRIEGFSTHEFHRIIDDDLMAILSRDALTALAVCKFTLDDQLLGYDGAQFYGETTRASRFVEFVEEERRVTELTKEAIELAPGQDEPANNAEVLRQVADYVRAEAHDNLFILDSLQYLRSAKVDETYYLIWEYHETDGRRCYVTFAHSPTGHVLSYNAAGDLTPEQYIYADYQHWF
ncbi:MAG TPA: hypothetical protein VL096_02270 [Pirellulaceae bacterium]|nr:hypothetical protein [Pirellulaceae bacterium]